MKGWSGKGLGLELDWLGVLKVEVLVLKLVLNWE